MRDGDSAEAAAEAILGATRFAAVRSLLAKLPGGIDRLEFWAALCGGTYIRRAYAALDPGWCRERDKALDEIRQAIQRFQSVLRKFDLGDDSRDVEPLVKKLSGALEREYRRVLDDPMMRASRGLGLDEWDEPDDPKMRAVYDTVSIMFPDARAGAGRPWAAWRARAEDGLLDAGVPKARVAAIVRAAGLAETSPRRAPRNPSR